MPFLTSSYHLAAWLILSASFTSATLQAAESENYSSNPPNVLEGQKLVQALQRGGYVIYFRHGITDLSTHDTDHDNLDNCETQRRLSPAGRQQMMDIGRIFKKLNIKIDEVLSSPLCRTVNSARLAFGKVTINNDLKYTVIADEADANRQALALRKLLATSPKAGTNTALSGHNGNLKEATGIWPRLEGVAVIFKPDDKGSFSYIATVPPTYWQELSRGDRSP